MRVVQVIEQNQSRTKAAAEDNLKHTFTNSSQTHFPLLGVVSEPPGKGETPEEGRPLEQVAQLLQLPLHVAPVPGRHRPPQFALQLEVVRQWKRPVAGHHARLKRLLDAARQ